MRDAGSVQSGNMPTVLAQPAHYPMDSSLEKGLDKLLTIVSEESGIEKAELRDDIQLADLGIDSLLSLIIASRLKDDLDFDLGTGISLFDEFKTLGSLEDAYARSKGLSLDNVRDAGPKGEQDPGLLTPPSESDMPENLPALKESWRQSNDARPVTSLVLQQAKTPDSTLLFLFPDGSGSAASYVSIPRMSPSIGVVALISPYRHNAESMTCTLESLLRSYITEIKRRQPTGNYTLGGWSSGGVFAFCAAQMLLDEGHQVSNILLLDSPPMRVGDGLGQLPDRFYDHCREVGVFQQIGASDSTKDASPSPDWLIEHFKATVNLLASHRATPLKVPPGLENPRVSMCLAGKSALDGTRYGTFEREAGDSTDVDFLIEAHDDSGPGLWADLFPGIPIAVTTLHEWDHFNMMVGDGAKALCDFLASHI